MPAAAALKVMVVDDQACMREVIRRTLQDSGIRDIRTRASAAEALADIRQNRVHLIISDFNMPDMDGLQLLKEVRGDPVINKTVFMMLTGRPDRQLVEEAAALRINNFLKKPFTPAGPGG